jgi:hypothetical protein
MAMSEQMSQALSLADVINLTNNNNTNSNSVGIDMSKFRQVMYNIFYQTGAGSVDGRLQSSPNSNFNVVHNITNSNLTTLNTNNTMETVEVRADQVNQQNAGDRYVRLQLTVSGGATNVSAVGWGGNSEQKPANQYDLNSSYIVARVVVNT